MLLLFLNVEDALRAFNRNASPEFSVSALLSPERTRFCFQLDNQGHRLTTRLIRRSARTGECLGLVRVALGVTRKSTPNNHVKMRNLGESETLKRDHLLCKSYFLR